jgi:hypothetical protein
MGCSDIPLQEMLWRTITKTEDFAALMGQRRSESLISNSRRSEKIATSRSYRKLAGLLEQFDADIRNADFAYIPPSEAESLQIAFYFRANEAQRRTKRAVSGTPSLHNPLQSIKFVSVIDK